MKTVWPPTLRVGGSHHVGLGFRATRRGGFNRIELLAVMVIVVLLMELVLPAIAKAGSGSKTGRCLNNLDRLITAWGLYAADNNERLAMNYHGGLATGIDNNTGPGQWAVGWLDWTIAPANTNRLFLTLPKYSRLSSYLNGDAKVFKCPADTFLSAPQKARGWKERVRSVSANISIGDGNAEAGPLDTIYKHVRKLGDFVNPGPAESWVYLDEHPDSINDPAFFSPRPATWIDQPATYHEGATSLAFADGHAEGHRWTGSLATNSARKVTFSGFSPPRARTGDADISWLSYHTPRVSEKSF